MEDWFCIWENNFNPRSHEGSDNAATKTGSTSVISIHAPTRGATKRRSGFVFKKIISIHAPTRGATVYRFRSYDFLQISIHAPTRGATSRTWDSGIQIKISIHAPTRGATKSHKIVNAKHVFQSTLPRGERRIMLRDMRFT